MATNTHIMLGDGRALPAVGCPVDGSPTVTLALGNRHQIGVAIEALIDILDEQDDEPQFVLTPAGRAALDAAR